MPCMQLAILATILADSTLNSKELEQDIDCQPLSSKIWLALLFPLSTLFSGVIFLSIWAGILAMVFLPVVLVTALTVYLIT
jgi:hypothetical protein